MKTITEQIASAKRELALRKHVYPGMLATGKMTADQCRHEIECMEAIIKTLERESPQKELFQ